MSSLAANVLDEEYQLSESDIRQYQQDGHILLRGVCPPRELTLWRSIISDCVRERAVGAKPLEERDTYGKAFLQIGNVWKSHSEAARFVLAKRFGQIAAGLMGVRGVRLYHDQALFKEAGGGHTPWHQDQYYWPLDGVKTITMWMPLVDVNPEMGAMTFASKSHNEGFLGHIKISDESEDFFSEFVQEKGYNLRTDSMSAGDATFHSGWTLHCAPGNNSTHTREVMTIIYLDMDGIISEPDNPNRENDLRVWFPGLKARDAAASELNPIVWQKD